MHRTKGEAGHLYTDPDVGLSVGAVVAIVAWKNLGCQELQHFTLVLKPHQATFVFGDDIVLLEFLRILVAHP